MLYQTDEKMKLDKNTKILLAIAVVLGAVYFFKDTILSIFRKSPSDDDLLTSEEQTDARDSDTETHVWTEPKYLTEKVKSGSRGEHVKKVQIRINEIIKLVKSQHEPTEYFKTLSKTYQAVLIAKSQVIAKIPLLSTDGIAGSKTMGAIKLIFEKDWTTLEETRIKYATWDKLVD